MFVRSHSQNQAENVVKIGLFILLLGTTRAAAFSQDIAGKSNEYLDAHVKMSRFSGSVLIARKGEILFKKACGLANAELSVPNTPQTKFRLGSLTKQFTSMAVMILEEQKKLSTADPVAKFLPEYPNGDKITIHHLLTHTSGIPNFTDYTDYRKAKLMPSPPEKTMEMFRDKPLEFQPGEKFKYSNSGYILLTLIVEKASGMSYERFVRERIFDPLKMDDTGYDHNSAILKNRALGYSLLNDAIVNAPYIDMTIPAGAGAIYSTVDDLYAWDRALYTEKLVSRATLEKMFTPFKDNFGFGWMITTAGGRKTISHGGGIEGFSAQIIRFPDDDACVVVLSNFDFAPTGRISRDLAAILFGTPYEMPKENKPAAADPPKIAERIFSGSDL